MSNLARAIIRANTIISDRISLRDQRDRDRERVREY